MSAAAHTRHQLALRGALSSITVQDIMAKECSIINPQLSLSHLVHDCVLATGQRYFVIADGARLQGIVTMANIKSIPKEQWDSTRVGEIMTPAGKLKTARPGQTAAGLLEQMDELGINLMPVAENDEVIGIVTRDSLVRFVKTRAELGM